MNFNHRCEHAYANDTAQVFESNAVYQQGDLLTLVFTENEQGLMEILGMIDLSFQPIALGRETRENRLFRKMFMRRSVSEESPNSTHNEAIIRYEHSTLLSDCCALYTRRL